MSVADIWSIAQNLKQLIEYNADLILGVKDEAESLSDQLTVLNGFLKDATHNNAIIYQIVIDWVTRIRNVAFEIEDAIDRYCVMAAAHNAKSTVRKKVRIKYPAQLRQAAKTIEKIKLKLESFKKELIPPIFVLEIIYRTTQVVEVGETSTSITTWGRIAHPLPHHLKICFIYFAVFPSDFIIPAWKLFRLWVAEGLIQKSDQDRCNAARNNQDGWEAAANEYLNELVNKKLIIVQKRKSINNDRIKKCRINNDSRKLCLGEAANQMFLEEITQIDEDYQQENHHRRLSMCFSPFNSNIFLLPVTNVRSFFCFAQDQQWNLPPEDTGLKKFAKKIYAFQQSESLEEASHFSKAFRLLKVLEISISLNRFPSEMLNLVHLRYLALSGNIGLLPPSISKLRNLQTLIVDTTSRILDVDANIWKLLQLTYVRTTSPIHFLGPPAPDKAPKKNPRLRKSLHTLSMLSPDSCTENILKRALRVKKLGICGKLVSLVEENEGKCMFDSFTELAVLETLKLLNDQELAKLPRLPPKEKFPSNLKKLTLSNTWLDWTHMTHLEGLANLEVLKLRDNAFVGHTWKLCDGGFGQLRVLQLGKTDLVTWEASNSHFPCLQCLILKECESLTRIPSALGDLSSLQILELYGCSSSAAASARLIQQRQQQNQNELKLHIHPPTP